MIAAPSSSIAHIAELWRYPVKSMGGERTDALDAVCDGIAHDRRYAFLSSGAPVGRPRLTSRERAALLRYSARANGKGTDVLTPEGRTYGVDDPALILDLEQHLPHGNRITLEHEAGAPPYTDVRPVALVSTQTLASVSRTFGRHVDPRRFRSNLVLNFDDRVAAQLNDGEPDAFPEDALTGFTLQVGDTCRLRLLERIPRCRVVTLHPDTTEPNPMLMRHLDRRHAGRLGIYAAVITPGTIRVGDSVRIDA